MVGWRFAGATDRGQVREHNEDAYSVRNGASGVFVVADGLGGHQGGEVASQLAVECVERGLVQLAHTSAWRARFNFSRVESQLVQVMRDANAAVYAAAEREPSLRGMGCTLLAALIRKNRVSIAHVGDVRAYLWRDHVLQQLTADHTEVTRLIVEGVLSPQEARHYPFRNRVERAVGGCKNLMVDVQSLDVLIGDRLLFCSDGLWNMLDDANLTEILAQEYETEVCVNRLVHDANAAGGKDNITVILVDLMEEDQSNAVGTDSH